jgi:hypothetical protein
VLIWLLVAIAVLAVGALSLWVIPWLLTLSPSEGVSAAERLKARNDARAPVIAFAAAIGAGITLWYTRKTYLDSRDRQITDRYSHAVDQLASAHPAAQLGGVYALERIAGDSPRDRRMIVYVLGAFIRESTREPQGQRGPSEPVYAALRVALRLVAHGAPADLRLDLRGAHLENTRFPPGARLDRVMMDGAHLEGADLPGPTAV